jgi:uncharacterized protein
MMLLTGTGPSPCKCLTGALLALLGALGVSLPARADLYRAEQDYKAADYPHAFQEFLALAELGQPVAQLDVAIMYRAGQGVEASDIHAYAWATLAAQNGEAKGSALADTIRPQLAPGSERVAGWLTSGYTPAALTENLLPFLAARPTHFLCKLVKWYEPDYPLDARSRGIDGTVLVDFTVMPDGSARFPRIIYAVPAGHFESAVRDSVLRSRFGQLPANSQPIDCSFPYRFKLTGSPDWSRALDYLNQVKSHATPDDPNAEFQYGLLLGLPQFGQSPDAGMPWIVKAAQGGVPVAEYQLGFCLLGGRCGRDPSKALKWLELAADGGEPEAELTLAIRALSEAPGPADLARAQDWLNRAAASGNDDASLYLASVLAAAPQPALRDPKRALELLRSIDSESDDPATFEIRAAAQAATGDFTSAIRSEQKAIRRARDLAWDPEPLELRLARYQSRNPWYGSLFTFPP